MADTRREIGTTDAVNPRTTMQLSYSDSRHAVQRRQKTSIQDPLEVIIFLVLHDAIYAREANASMVFVYEPRLEQAECLVHINH